MQVIRCKVENCGFHGKSGFCLNRLVVINDRGMCDYITKPGWDQQVEEFCMSNYRPKEKETELLEDNEEHAAAGIMSQKPSSDAAQEGLPRDN